MTEEFRRIRFDEFANDLVRIFKLVSREREPVIVENDEGEGVVIRPLDSATTGHKLTEDEYNAFRSTFGGWADVDTDTLKQNIYESRKSSRSPVSPTSSCIG